MYEDIVENKLDPAEFDFDDTGDRVTVTHNSGSTYEFSPKTVNLVPVFGSVGDDDPFISTEYEVRFSVAEGINETSTTSSITSAAEVYFSRWLREIRLTVGVPDYWAEMKRGRAAIAIVQRGDFGNTPFTPTEQRQIAAQLKEVAKQVKELYRLSDRQMTQVKEKLDEVAEAASRLGRKDWIIIFLGTILPLVINDVLSWAAAHHIWAMTLNGLIHLFTGTGGPPQILT